MLKHNDIDIFPNSYTHILQFCHYLHQHKTQLRKSHLDILLKGF